MNDQHAAQGAPTALQHELLEPRLRLLAAGAVEVEAGLHRQLAAAQTAQPASIDTLGEALDRLVAKAEVHDGGALAEGRRRLAALLRGVGGSDPAAAPGSSVSRHRRLGPLRRDVGHGLGKELLRVRCDHRSGRHRPRCGRRRRRRGGQAGSHGRGRGYGRGRRGRQRCAQWTEVLERSQGVGSLVLHRGLRTATPSRCHAARRGASAAPAAPFGRALADPGGLAASALAGLC